MSRGGGPVLLVLGLAALATLGATCGGDGSFEPARYNPHRAVFNPNVSRPTTSQLQVQMAYNLADGKIYGRVCWTSNEGRLDQFYRYRGGQWVLEGGPRREIEDPAQIASSEARLSLMWGDANNAAFTPNFQQMGCALACHDNGQFMPDFTEDGAIQHESMRLPEAPFYQGTALDLWYWGAHVSNPIGYWIDEAIDDTQPEDGGHQHDDDAREPDEGFGGFEANLLINGNPVVVYDPASTSNGGYAVPFSELATSPDYFFADPSDPTVVSGIQPPLVLAYADAAAMGYVPQEDDTVPYWVLSRPQEDRGDIQAVLSHDGGATVSQRSHYDPASGMWQAYFTRSLATAGPQDLRFQRNRQYVVAFAMHRDQTRGRDHYFSFPQVVWIEDPRNPGGFAGADFMAKQLTTPGQVPDFDDFTTYPPFLVDLVLPGVLSFEFLTDSRDAAYLFGQQHGGYDDLQPAVTGAVGIGCRACHTLRDEDPFTPFLEGGSLQFKTARRGGLFEATPISLEFNVRPSLESRCLPCHAPGGAAASIPFAGVSQDRSYASLIAPGRIDWRHPADSPLLRIPAENRDGHHPPDPPLEDFDASPDYQRILYWILYNAPNN